MAGALLADAGVGETPLPPVPIAVAAAAATAADGDPVARLSRELLGLLALAMDPAACPALSPRYPYHNISDIYLWAMDMPQLAGRPERAKRCIGPSDSAFVKMHAAKLADQHTAEPSSACVTLPIA